MPDPCYHLYMKHWCLTFCLVVASLFGSVGVGRGAGPCGGNDREQWRNCTKRYSNSCSSTKSDFGTKGEFVKRVITYHDKGEKLVWAGHSTPTYILANGDKYVGQWQPNVSLMGSGRSDYYRCGRAKEKIHGVGTYTYADGRVVKGL